MMVEKKNEKEFECLFREMYSRLCLYAESIVGDDDVAKDIVQQVFMQLWMKANSCDWTKELRGYLFRSVYNAAINVIRHERVRHDFLEFLRNQESEEDGSNPLLFDRDDQEKLIRKVNELIELMPEQMREIFLLSRFVGKSAVEIAEQLGLSTRTVENQLYRAMKYLREELQGKKAMLLLSFLLKWKKNHFTESAISNNCVKK